MTALALTEQHADVYPKGVFEQEREILGIEALRRQHKRRAALERAAHFLAHYRGSLYAFRVQTLLDQSPTPPSNRAQISSGEQVVAIHAGAR